MALKYKIAQAAYDKLSDDMKKEYVAGESDGEFLLDVTELPRGEDAGPVKRALESERAKNKALKAERDTLQAKVDEAPDVDAIKASHQKETEKLTKFAEKTLRESVASEMASKVSNAPALLKPHILSRLMVDLTGDEPVTKVLGADGKASDLTLEKLQQEIVANKDYKAIIVGSRASGGGAPPATIKPLGGGAPKDGEQATGDKAPDLSKMAPADLAARITTRKEAEAAAAQAT